MSEIKEPHWLAKAVADVYNKYEITDEEDELVSTWGIDEEDAKQEILKSCTPERADELIRASTELKDHVSRFIEDMKKQIASLSPEGTTTEKPIEKYEALKHLDYINVFHSSIINKSFGNFAKQIPLDGKVRNIAKENEYYITVVSGKRLKNPLAINVALTLENAEEYEELIKTAHMTLFDFLVFCVVCQHWKEGNRSFTTLDFYRSMKGDYKARARQELLDEIEKSLEKLSSIRIQVKTVNRSTGEALNTEKVYLINTRANKRKTSNGKEVDTYDLLDAPALVDFPVEENPFYKIPVQYLNYGSKANAIRAFNVALFLIQRIELQKHAYTEYKTSCKEIAIKSAKAAEKEAALREHRKPNYKKDLHTEQYYPNEYYKKRTAVIEFSDFLARVEDKDVKDISKDVKSTLKSEALKCLDHYTEIGYIKRGVIPAGTHNQTNQIIIELPEFEQEKGNKKLTDTEFENEIKNGKH